MLQRGDLALAFYPFAAGIGGSRRPVLVIQADQYNERIGNVIVAQVTTNLTRAHDPAYLHDSLISCLNLATLTDHRIDKSIGRLSDVLMHEVDDALRTALDLVLQR